MPQCSIHLLLFCFFCTWLEALKRILYIEANRLWNPMSDSSGTNYSWVFPLFKNLLINRIVKSNNQNLGQKINELAQMPSGLFAKPSYLFAITIISIFFSEAFVMLILSYFPLTSVFKGALIDATILTIIVFPVLLLFVLRPMRNYLYQRTLLEEEREKLIEQLNKTIAEIKVLKGIIPICASCKNVRTDQGFWQQVEVYISDHSEANFSHGICPDCTEKLYPKE